MEKEMNNRNQYSLIKFEGLTKENKIGIFIVLLFILLNQFSSTNAAILMSLCSIYPIALWIRRRKLNAITVFSLVMLVFTIVFSVINYSQFSLYHFISELKIIMLFTLPYFFYFLMKELDYLAIILSFFKFFSLLVASNSLYGYLFLGEFRYTGILDYSIYISVSLVLLMSFLYHHISVKWKVLTLFSVIMLGSSNGLLIFLIVWLVKVSLPIWMRLIPSYFSMVYLYWYVTDFRGREIADGGFWEIDRVLLITSLNRYTLQEFTLYNYIFGFGIGRPLKNFQIVTQTTNNEVMGFIQWFNDFSFNGVYPFSFHNEFTRIFYNFGMIGVIMIFLYLYNNLDKTTFFILVLACITNTIIYSTVGLFVLALIMAVTMLEKNKRTIQKQLSSQNSHSSSTSFVDDY